MSKNISNSDKRQSKAVSNEGSGVYQAYLVNEKGEEIPITEEMMTESMAKIKLKSIGTHTGHSPVITDELLAESNDA